MKANEINLNRFLAQSETQFIIPVYQRNYDWTYAQCKQLIDDILEVGQNSKISAHFIGSIVYVHDDVYSASGIRELTIIDGQQRLTTITLLYLVVYKLAVLLEDKQLQNKINEQYLINKFDEEEGAKLKLRPTENNDKALRYLLRGDEKEEFNEYARLVENYNYFKGKVSEENYKVVLDGLGKLMFVEISLDRDKDDPQKIFESLNSTGLELSEADLIRNYILMGLNRKKQNAIYKKYWEVIESLAKDTQSNQSKVSSFIRDFLTIKNKKIPNKNKVYHEFKINYPITDYDELEIILSEVKTLAKHYNKLLNPSAESDVLIRTQLGYISKLEINVSFPFLLQVYEDYAESRITKDIFISILELVQSFVWRRFIVGLPTNALNKIFMRLYEDVDMENYYESIALSLINKKGTQRFPRDTEITNNLNERDLYNIQSKNRTYFLERLENHNNKEPVKIEGNTQITIEHIFPQNPDPKWKINLGEDEYNLIKENYLNTIANLTLSGNNGKLGNKYFTDKRDMNVDGGEQGYKFSRLWLNRDLVTLDEWNTSHLKQRCKKLESRFFDIWPLPNVSYIIEEEYSEINIFDADEPTNKKLEYAVFFGQKIETRYVSELYKHIMTQLFELQPQTFFTSDLKDKLAITKKPDDLRQAAEINDTYFIESNLDSKGKFDRIKLALEIFDFEDELIVKYAKE